MKSWNSLGKNAPLSFVVCIRGNTMEWGRWGRVLFDVGSCQGLPLPSSTDGGVAQLGGAPHTVCSTATNSSWDLMQRHMTSLNAGTCPQKQYIRLWLQWSLHTSGQSELEIYVHVYVCVYIYTHAHTAFHLQAANVTASAEQQDVMSFYCYWLNSWLCFDRHHPERQSTQNLVVEINQCRSQMPDIQTQVVFWNKG